MLNFACGARIHESWENIDFSPIDRRVKKVNLLGRLPYADESFDVTYSSHFLEHLEEENAARLLGEVRRILKQNGILRLVVPDLENIAKEYLAILEKLDECEAWGESGGGKWGKSGGEIGGKIGESYVPAEGKNRGESWAESCGESRPETCAESSESWREKHEWILLEAFDQMTRTNGGGGNVKSL